MEDSWLDFILDEIEPLGFLHLDVEGWEAYSLRRAGEALRGVIDTCFVICEVWDDRDRKRRYLPLSDADGSGPPCDNSSPPWRNILTSSRIDDIVDHNWNLCFPFRGEKDSGEGRWP